MAEDAVQTPPEETQEAPTAGQAKQQALDAVKESLRAGREEAEAEAPEGEAPEATTEEPSGDEPSPEKPRPAGDGIPTPVDRRTTQEGDPEGTYREPSTGRLKDAETHRYMEEPGVEEEAPDAEAEAAEKKPAGRKIELPEGHPLRDRGITEIPVPEEMGQTQYEALRNLANTPVKNREIERERERRRQLERQMAELRARQDVLQSEEALKYDPERNDELRKQIEDHRQAYGEEAAELLEEALAARRDNLVRDRVSEVSRQQEMDRRAEEFLSTVQEYAPRRYGLWAEKGVLAEKLQGALAQYAQRVDTTPEMEPDVQQFFGELDLVYARDPAVREKLKERMTEKENKTREQLREEIRQEEREKLEAENEKQLKEAATRHGTRPPDSRVPRTETGARTPRPEDEELDTTGMTASQIARARRDRLKQGLARG